MFLFNSLKNPTMVAFLSSTTLVWIIVIFISLWYSSTVLNLESDLITLDIDPYNNDYEQYTSSSRFSSLFMSLQVALYSSFNWSQFNPTILMCNL
jgi:hypothetical protein